MKILMCQKGEKLRKFGNFASNFHCKKSGSIRCKIQGRGPIQKFKNLKTKNLFYLLCLLQTHRLFRKSSVAANVATRNNYCHCKAQLTTVSSVIGLIFTQLAFIAC